MKKSILKPALLAFFASISLYSFSQPIPVEVMAGNKYTSVDVTVAKSFTQNSRLGFFHINTLQADYINKQNNCFVVLDMLTYEVVKNFRIVGGAFYGMPGFNTTAGLQYNYVGKNVFLLFAPRVNITDVPSYDIITILQIERDLTEKTKFYTRLKLLNVFDAGGHIKSYQWFRLGLERKGTQFGLAANFDEYGPHPKVQYNLGLFIRREIF
jgi:hypothetical protein